MHVSVKRVLCIFSQLALHKAKIPLYMLRASLSCDNSIYTHPNGTNSICFFFKYDLWEKHHVYEYCRQVIIIGG